MIKTIYHNHGRKHDLIYNNIKLTSFLGIDVQSGNLSVIFLMNACTTRYPPVASQTRESGAMYMDISLSHSTRC